MNAKERVRNCIRRRATDRVPLGFYLVDHDTIGRVIGRPTYLRNKVGCQVAWWEGRREEVVESMKADIVDFYRKIDLCDIITYKESARIPPRGYRPEDPPRKVAEKRWEDRKGRVYALSEISNEIICVHDPDRDKREYTLEEFTKPVDDPLPDPSVLEVYDHMLDAFAETRYIAGLTGGVNNQVLLGGMERGLMAYATEPELVRAAIARSVEQKRRLDAFYIRPCIDAAFVEEDLCSKKGPMLSPAMYRDMCLPAFKQRIAQIRSHGDFDIVYHSCGNTRALLEQFIEAGVQVYQSIQTIPEMEIGALKRDFGDRLILWGGVPVEELVGGTPETVRAAVRESMEKAAPGGGFILGPSHSIAFGTKYENFMAMLDEYDRLADRC